MLKESKIVRSQLIPLDNMRLVLPNTTVAEVINYESPEKLDKPPKWLMGVINWRGISIPVVKFETLSCGKSVAVSNRSRIIILNAMSKSVKQPFYGVLSQGIPRLMSLNDESITDSPDKKELSYVLRSTLINGDEAVIPDQNAIEAELGNANLSEKKSKKH